jgi:hypothetical protein
MFYKQKFHLYVPRDRERYDSEHSSHPRTDASSSIFTAGLSQFFISYPLPTLPKISQGNCGPSIRRAWHDTSCEDRTAYLNAVELLYKLPSTNSLGIPNYFVFVRIHAGMNANYAHGANDGPFLPWHRWYLWKFEEALQIVSGSCVTVPYWDWSKDKGKEMQSSLLQPESFGSSIGIDSNGCVIEGLCNMNDFWTSTARTGGCLKR